MFPARDSASVHPSAGEVQSQGAGSRGACARLRGMRMRMPRCVQSQPNPKPWQMETPGWFPCFGWGSLLSSHVTDEERDQQLPHSPQPLCNMHYCPSRWTVQSSGWRGVGGIPHLPTATQKATSPSPAWRWPGFNLRLEPAQQPK